jgi:hypothetical protein
MQFVFAVQSIVNISLHFENVAIISEFRHAVAVEVELQFECTIKIVPTY